VPQSPYNENILEFENDIFTIHTLKNNEYCRLKSCKGSEALVFYGKTKEVNNIELITLKIGENKIIFSEKDLFVFDIDQIEFSFLVLPLTDAFSTKS
jgi:hypothetical protein